MALIFKPGGWTFVVKLWILALVTFVAVAAVFMLKPIPQSLAYHNFADNRPVWGIPNFLNVISNIPFLVTGVAGFSLLSRAAGARRFIAIYAALFTGVLLTGLGSAWYHYRPDNATLIYDRLPMTIVFMSLLSVTVGELISPVLGNRLLAPLLLIGVVSVLWWSYTESKGVGDLRLYILVQYCTVLLILLILLLFPSPERGRVLPLLIRVVIWYAVAKAFDLCDQEIYSFTGLVSGHSLKHLAAAWSTWYLVKLVK